jgi:parvulin-like peptidyl-prolyl isomerase
MRRRYVILVLPSFLLLGAAASRGEIVERVVAKVNGQIITLSDFQTRQLAAAQAARIEPDAVGPFLRQQNARILQAAIDEILLLQKAEDAGLRPPPQYLEEVIDSIKKENNLTTEEQFAAALEREGLSLGELRGNIEKSITQKMIVQREIEPKIAVSEAEIKAEYEKLKDGEFTKPATVALQEILVKDDTGGEALAKEIVAKARAGEDFQVLARAHSAAPSRTNGGDVGEIAEPDMNRELRDLARTLGVGGVSDPLRVEGGFRIVKIVAKKAGTTTAYEAAKEQVREKLMLARFDKEYDNYIQELRKNARIELRVREVPLQLTGPIPEGSLLEALDPLAPVAPAGHSGAGSAAPSRAPEAAAPAAAPAAGTDDEIQATPQAAPERVAPALAPATPPPATKPEANRPPG